MTYAILLIAILLPAELYAGSKLKLSQKALDIHKQAIVIDGHNDLPWALRAKEDMDLKKYDISKSLRDFHTDIPRLRQGGVGAQFWSAYVPAKTMFEKTSVRMTLEQIDLIHRMVKKYPKVFEFADTADDIVRIHKQGKIASMIGVEGGHSIANSLGVLRAYHQLGVRYMTLTHSLTLDWADSATDDQKNKGLTSLGKKILTEMNNIGIFIDISHVSQPVMIAALKHTRAPVIFSHSSANAIAAHARNVPDDVLRMLKGNGGVVMVNFYSGFVEPLAAKKLKNVFAKAREMRQKYKKESVYKKKFAEWKKSQNIPKGSVATVVDHIDHIVKVAGVNHVGLGADYDGVDMLPEQLEDVSSYPYITQELLNRGYKKKDILKILGGNLLRAMKKMEQASLRKRSLKGS